MPKYDAIVLGLGAMGSAALYQLAKRGARVLGIDQFSPPHDLGSSHGDTRITRLAIGEGEHYTPLVKRSHEIWRQIERETGADLFTQCGELIISSETKSSFTHVANFYQNTVDAARRYHITHELLGASQMREHFPAFNVRDEEFGYFEPEAGFLRPEGCIAAELALAEKYGAEIHRNEVAGFDSGSQGVSVRTDLGLYQGDALILAAGAWIPGLIDSSVSRVFNVYLQTLAWFAVEGDPESFRPGKFPVFIWELPNARHGIYGFPKIDAAGVKIATEQYAATVRPESADREIGEREIAALYRDLVAPNFRGVSARCTKTATCFYTVTPDAGFVIDRLSGAPRVIVASCCSGHGFKHSPAIGEILCDMALGCPAAFDLTPFRLDRFR